MMGHRQVEQAALFYEFSLARHIPVDHLLRSIDKFVDLEDLRRELERSMRKPRQARQLAAQWNSLPFRRPLLGAKRTCANAQGRL